MGFLKLLFFMVLWVKNKGDCGYCSIVLLFDCYIAKVPVVNTTTNKEGKSNRLFHYFILFLKRSQKEKALRDDVFGRAWGERVSLTSP